MILRNETKNTVFGVVYTACNRKIWWAAGAQLDPIIINMSSKITIQIELNL